MPVSVTFKVAPKLSCPPGAVGTLYVGIGVADTGAAQSGAVIALSCSSTVTVPPYEAEVVEYCMGATHVTRLFSVSPGDKVATSVSSSGFTVDDLTTSKSSTTGACFFGMNQAYYGAFCPSFFGASTPCLLLFSFNKQGPLHQGDTQRRLNPRCNSHDAHRRIRESHSRSAEQSGQCLRGHIFVGAESHCCPAERSWPAVCENSPPPSEQQEPSFRADGGPWLPSNDGPRQLSLGVTTSAPQGRSCREARSATLPAHDRPGRPTGTGVDGTT